MIVKCNRPCWDAKRNRKYFHGDQDDIDPLEPIAGNFDFPPGTEVYYKKPGNKNTPAMSSTRIVPGQVQEKDRLKVLESEEALLLKKLEAIQKEKEPLKAEIRPELEPKTTEESLSFVPAGEVKKN
ncbi:MAG: hypothetical protein PHD04_00865 [Candidatus Pacebacteria bacterium]|nr:hypothetical protein [Candidatus Paceibacterota bacterium]